MAFAVLAISNSSIVPEEASQEKEVMAKLVDAGAVQPMREPLLDRRSYESAIEYLKDESIPELIRDLESGEVDQANLGYAWHDLGSKHLDVVFLEYCAGQPVAQMKDSLLQAIDAFDRNMESETPAIVFADLSIQTYYVDALWLLSLAKLLGLGDAQVERVANIYAADETNDGADELFELILAKLGRKSFEAEGLIHEDPYQLLLDCIKAEPEARPALMTQFLKRWFKGQKECDWWGSHINRRGTPVLDTGFFGYWAFEAALVTYLWDIDDSTYRDLPHYPKDLIDYARQNFPLGAQAPDMRLRVMAGQPCPREGWWFTPAKTNSRRLFKAGEVMPDVGGDYGATIWQWDEQQGT
jgi:Domain of unknown function (DUF1911)/Domain of unknown function (DUF1910)